ncbi:MAG: hypothetical protein U0Q19_01730 [Kineosporiaceae bacterium]
MSRSLPLPGPPVPAGATFRVQDCAVWFPTSAGVVASVGLTDGRARTWSGGHPGAVAVLPAPDGLRLHVITAAGAVVELPRREAADDAGRIVADLARPVVAAHADDDGTLLVLTGGPDGALLRVDPADGSIALLAGPFEDPWALAVQDSGDLTVLTGAGVDPAAVTVDPAGNVVAQAILAGEVSAVTAAPGGGLILADPVGALSEVDATGVVSGVTGSVGAPVVALTRWGSLVLALTDAALVCLEWGMDEDPPAGAVIVTPLAPVVPGGWAPLEVDISRTGLTWADVAVEAIGMPDAGLVSTGIQAGAGATTRTFRFVAAALAGEHEIVVARRSDGVSLGRARVRVSPFWPERRQGPPIAVTGPVHTLMAWGGGPPGQGNYRKHPAPEAWRVAVVFVETRDKGFQQPVAAARADWTTRLIGPGASAKQYYEEVSYLKPAVGSPLTGTTIEVAESGMPGVVRIDAGWGDLFENRDTAKVTPAPFGGWWTTDDQRATIAGAYSDALIDAGIDELILNRIDAVVFVIQNASEDVVKVGKDTVLRTKFCWPQAWQGVRFHTKDEFSTTIKPKPAIFLPTAWPTAMPPDPGGLVKSWTNILCHELGHTLGCDDLYAKPEDYADSVNNRVIGPLDLMDNDWWAPHFSLAHRMRLGWLPPTWLEDVDFAADPRSRTVRLQAIETLARTGPSGGRKAGIEVHVRPGRSYYVEYRRSQPGQMGDNGLNRYFPSTRLVVGTDVVTDGSTPYARPDILALPVDADGDGPVLTTPGTDYAETDVTDPNRQHDFRLVLDPLPADPDSAEVRVEYIAAHRADLQIQPAPGRRPNGPPDWKSPDIWLEGPAGTNVISKGARHTIVARVYNAGSAGADTVRVKIFTMPFTVTAGTRTEVLPAAAPQRIPSRQSRTFRIPWDVPKNEKVADLEVEHYCVRVEIDRYIDPVDPNRNEIVLVNNNAQSNFDTTTVGHGSPSDRRVTGVVVGNDLSRTATYQLAPDQTSPWFRTYLGHSWVRLAAGEERMVEVAYESLAGDPVRGDGFEREVRGDRPLEPNRLALSSLVEPSGDGQGDSGRIVFGAGLTVHAGLRTAVRDLELRGEAVTGTVSGDRDGRVEPVTSGWVNVAVWPAEAPERGVIIGGAVRPDGTFTALVPGDLLVLVGQVEIVGEGFFLGSWPWGPCRSGEQRLA